MGAGLHLPGVVNIPSQLSVGTTADPNSKAVIDQVSTTKGSLQPRMTTVQQNAIAAVPEALSIYDLTLHRPAYYNGTSWLSLASLSGTETFTNKTLTSPTISSPTGLVKADVGLGNVDNTSDATKNAAAVTLTNKTLTSPVINSPTGIVKADVGLGNVDNTSDATKNAAAVTLTNKTLDNTNTFNIKDSLFTLQDDGGSTRTFQFQLSSITAGNLRTWTVPDFSDTFVGTTGTQTLTGKTLSGNIATNLVSGAATLTFPTTTGTLATLANSETFTNKTLTAPAINNANTNYGTASNTQRLLLPTETTTNLAGLTNTAGLIAYDSTQAKPVYNNGSAWTTIGSGGSGGNIGDRELISNTDIEINSTGYTAYADAAAATPVDGTGGSPVSTIARDTSSPITGTGNLLWTKAGGANRQGDGFSIPFTVGTADQAKVLQIDFDYIVGSGTFTAGSSSTDSDIEIYIYDVTNSTLIQPSSYKLLSNSTTIADHFRANFQTSSNGTSYRLIWHTATTTTNNFTIKFDNVSVHPSKYVFGTPITDWASYSPTISGFGVTTTSGFTWRRVGDSIEIQGYWTNGTSAASLASITLPNGYTINTTKIDRANTTAANGQIIGVYSQNSTGNSGYAVTATGTSNSLIYFAANFGGSTATIPANGSGVGVSSGIMAFRSFLIPITGLSSSVQMSDVADSRVVAGSFYYSANSAALSANAVIPYPNTALDTHGAWNSATGLYTIPVAGNYLIQISGHYGTNAVYNVYKNGSLVQPIAQASNAGAAPVVGSGQVVLPLVGGDTISIRPHAGVTLQYSTTASGQPIFSIIRLTGPTAIAATETIAASYWVSANFAASSTTPINFDSKEYDTHSAVTPSATVWKFTAPAAGLYLVTGLIGSSATSVNVQIFKNGAAFKNVGNADPASATSEAFTGTIRLIAGDYIDIRVLTAITVTGGAAEATAGVTNVAITRIGL